MICDFLHASSARWPSSLFLRGSPRKSGHSSRSRTRLVPTYGLLPGAIPGASRLSACPAGSALRQSELPRAPAPPLREATHAADIQVATNEQIDYRPLVAAPSVICASGPRADRPVLASSARQVITRTWQYWRREEQFTACVVRSRAATRRPGENLDRKSTRLNS